MNFFEIKDGALFFKRRQEIMEICPWGAGLRVRATQNRSFSHKNWALDIPAKKEGNMTFLMITLLSKTATSTLLLQTLDVSVSIMKRINFY